MKRTRLIPLTDKIPMAAHSLIFGSAPQKSATSALISPHAALAPKPPFGQSPESPVQSRLVISTAAAAVSLLYWFSNPESRIVILIVFVSFSISYLLLTIYKEANWARRSFSTAFSALVLNDLRGFEANFGDWRITLPSDPWSPVVIAIICMGLLLYDFRMRKRRCSNFRTSEISGV